MTTQEENRALRDELRRVMQQVELAATYADEMNDPMTRITLANLLESHRISFRGDGVGGRAEGFFGPV